MSGRVGRDHQGLGLVPDVVCVHGNGVLPHIVVVECRRDFTLFGTAVRLRRQ